MDKSLNNKIFIRTLFKHKLFFAINIFGLIAGITVGLFVFLYVHYEFGFDKFLEKRDQIYRVAMNGYQDGKLISGDAMGYPALGPAMQAGLPEVKSYARLKGENGLIGRRDKNIQFREFKIFYADNAFFDVFSFPFIEGDRATALSQPNSVVITQSAARKYFGNEDVLGKTLMFDGKDLYNITGVIRDLPDNSHMRLDFLFSFSSLYQHFGKDSVDHSWSWNEFYTYVLLDPRANSNNFEQKINDIAYRYKGQQWQKEGKKETLFIQPVADIHLHSNLLHEIKPTTSAKIIYFLLLAGIIIVVIAWINYVNLTTVKAFERAKEVGIQKVLGAERVQLMSQFLVENMLINGLAVLVAIGFISFLPALLFNFLGERLFEGNPLTMTAFWITALAIFLTGVIITGLYPAFLLSSFKPVSILKGKFKKSTGDILLRESLVTFQFLITMVLIGASIIIQRQISFMLNIDKGISINNMLAISSPRIFASDTVSYKPLFESFKNELLQNKNITGVSFSTLVPSKENYWIETARLFGQDSYKDKDIEVAAVDDDFLKTYHVSMKSGRFFSPGFPADQRSVIINEAALSYLGIPDAQEALKRKLVILDANRDVVGVMQNYRNLSLKNNFMPTIYVYRYVPRSYISVKIASPADYAGTVDFCSDKWKTFFPGNAFEYFFVEDAYQQQYSDEEKFRKIFDIATLLAVIIACLGLFGLTLYESVLRRKEIGIRKALGATTFDIIRLFSTKSLKILLIVFVISIPVIHFSMSRWLSNYVIHISLDVWIYLLTAFVVTFITLFTTVWQSIRASHHSPVKSLRQE